MKDTQAGSGELNIAEEVRASIGPYEADRIEHAWTQVAAGDRPVNCVACGRAIPAGSDAELILATGSSDTLAYAHSGCLTSRIVTVDVSETHDLSHTFWVASLLGTGLPPVLVFQRSKEAILQDEGLSVDEALWRAHRAEPICDLDSLDEETIRNLPALDGTYLTKQDPDTLELRFLDHTATVAGVEVNFDEGVAVNFTGLEILPDGWLADAGSTGQVVCLVGTGGIAFEGAPGRLLPRSRRCVPGALSWPVGCRSLGDLPFAPRPT